MTSKAAAKTMAVAIMLTMTMPTAAPASADPADDPAIYEVVSETIPVADIAYFDGTQFQRAEQVSLPWTTEVHVGDVTGRGYRTSRAEVRANWPIEPGSRPQRTGRTCLPCTENADGWTSVYRIDMRGASHARGRWFEPSRDHHYQRRSEVVFRPRPCVLCNPRAIQCRRDRLLLSWPPRRYVALATSESGHASPQPPWRSRALAATRVHT
ncbi:Uncharacterised protein [Mycobacteroides abscessus subsp. abscessus]|nr:hypothetical protein [Mycobacteroides abscessus]SHU35619.1 Uncharacterised protein [Mycobacteroides abscessus subsp. abscessus]SHV61965.1 Uncharacterised protein [Mycobacteroides abscessus subsp. abscessus]SIC22567.1 Uncharacterised protein [Mycobacteroides abscessus subsp. abscessus]SIG21452.1 Uncharacterised protein [Mycobacteroides abscessus subsp. abscessus]